MKIKEPFLLLFSISWILGCLLPREVRWRGEYRSLDWPMRIAFVAIGFAILLLWYSLPPH
jgi:hypothetical protein